MSTSNSWEQFDWSQPVDPAWALALDKAAPGVSSAIASASNGEPWYETLASVLPKLVLADNQRRLLNIQLERAQTGKPPLDSSNYGLGVNVGLSPDTSKIVMYGLVALGVILYATKKR